MSKAEVLKLKLAYHAVEIAYQLVVLSPADIARVKRLHVVLLRLEKVLGEITLETTPTR